jgi:hydroxypyruvate reductase
LKALSLVKLPTNLSRITRDAIEIWQAGVDAVRADRVVKREVQGDRRTLSVQGDAWELDPQGRLIIVGAGKATFGMAKGMEAVLENMAPQIDRIGWINIPEGTALEPLDRRIHVCEARPLGANEPTPLVIDGTQRILELVANAGPKDTVICLLSGGGSALLCAPVSGVTLEDKLAVTRALSSRGASIEQLNLVRSAISRVKRGGLARCCNAKQMITLVLSDVLGDPLETIASGPTVQADPIDLGAVSQMLKDIVKDCDQIPASVWRSLDARDVPQSPISKNAERSPAHHVHYILANNATAVDAAGIEAVRRGYAYYMESSPRSEGSAEDLGRALANQCLQLSKHPEIQCLITGGEPSVVLPSSGLRGKGGRNQHLVLAALDELLRQGVQSDQLAKMVILSGGTDGEDGPTDAAGAWLDEVVYERSIEAGLDTKNYLARCDSYNFFGQTASLLKTGPTHTNVCDIRVAIFDARSPS